MEISKLSVDLLVGIVPDCAGIVDHQIGILALLPHIPDTLKDTNELFGIPGIHLAAKGGHMKCKVSF